MNKEALQALAEKPIAVLGAGGVGKPIAADCALAGKSVRLWDRTDFAPKTLANIERTGLEFTGDQLNLYGFKRLGIARIDTVTDDMATAVKGAGIIVVATVAMAHQDLFKELIPLLEDGQVVQIFPDNYGCLLLRKMMIEAGCDKDIIVGGWSTSPYGARVVIKGGVITNVIDIKDRVIVIRGAALPDSDTEAFIETGKMLPALDAVTNGFGFQYGETILDIGFSNVNPVIHVPPVVLGVSTMQNFDTVLGQRMQDYSLYAFANCPAIAEVQHAFWKEEENITAAMGVGLVKVQRYEFFDRSSMYGKEYMGPDYAVPYNQLYTYKLGDGPFSLENRYVTEDVPIGCFVMQQFAQRYNVPCPVIDALSQLATIMIGRELCNTLGYTLDFLGIGHMTHEELHKWLREGVYTPAS